MTRGAYLAGPMTGIEDYNYPAFHDAAKQLRERGWVIVNPAENFGGDQSLDYEVYMKRALQQVRQAWAVVRLPGWQESKGAARELVEAERLKLPVLDLDEALALPFPPSGCRAPELSPFQIPEITTTTNNYNFSGQVFTMTIPGAGAQAPEPETVLQEAQRLVHGDRGADYGHPLDDFTKTAKIWSAILGVEVSPEQVGLCMVGVKLSRQVNKPKRDNLVDGAGYFETVSMVLEEQQRRAQFDQDWEATDDLV